MSEVQLKEKLKEVIYKSRKMVLSGQDWSAVMTIRGARWKTSAQGAKGVDKTDTLIGNATNAAAVANTSYNCKNGPDKLVTS
jgi:hypothetical protein